MDVGRGRGRARVGVRWARVEVGEGEGGEERRTVYVGRGLRRVKESAGKSEGRCMLGEV